jgi:hypothetical protein
MGSAGIPHFTENHFTGNKEGGYFEHIGKKEKKV